MAAVSNQYAAMPSLHIGWALWCTLAMWPVLRHARSRVAFAAYPVVTLFAIIVTANHFWLDAVGGVVVLAAGWQLAMRTEPLFQRRRGDRTSRSGGEGRGDRDLDTNTCAA